MEAISFASMAVWPGAKYRLAVQNHRAGIGPQVLRYLGHVDDGGKDGRIAS